MHSPISASSTRSRRAAASIRRDASSAAICLGWRAARCRTACPLGSIPLELQAAGVVLGRDYPRLSWTMPPRASAPKRYAVVKTVER
jgi:hypothetical protein